MFRSWVLGAALALGLVANAYAASDQQQLVDAAALTVEHLQSSQDPGAGKAREYIRRARAVLIVPQLVKGGFFVGAQGGNGVLVPRYDKTGWGNPGFYTMGAASFGLQIGVEVSEIVLIIMDDKALRAVTRNQFKVGAEAGIAVATLGAGAEANTTSNAGADIYGFAISKGLFGGIAVEGGVIHPRDGWASAYYGGKHTSSSVVHRDGVENPGADGLRKALNAL
ncbi:MAG TPA: lipid-binding SYLF domain-containing protein [Stellaceae bacterium]|nr:lipid-binding SYLF domain-containing protein [Stellaceae bacterium]